MLRLTFHVRKKSIEWLFLPLDVEKNVPLEQLFKGTFVMG